MDRTYFVENKSTRIDHFRIRWIFDFLFSRIYIKKKCIRSFGSIRHGSFWVVVVVVVELFSNKNKIFFVVATSVKLLFVLWLPRARSGICVCRKKSTLGSTKVGTPRKCHVERVLQGCPRHPKVAKFWAPLICWFLRNSADCRVKIVSNTTDIQNSALWVRCLGTLRRADCSKNKVILLFYRKTRWRSSATNVACFVIFISLFWAMSIRMAEHNCDFQCDATPKQGQSLLLLFSWRDGMGGWLH